MLKRWCGNVYSTSERNYQTFNKIYAKVAVAAMLEGKSMPSNMAANTNHTTLLKNQSAIKYVPWMRFLSNLGCKIILCALSIFGICELPTHCLKEALVTWPLSARGLLKVVLTLLAYLGSIASSFFKILYVYFVCMAYW